MNCVPFFQTLADSGFRGELISGVPSALNAQLHQGLLDISPSSSFEYARHWSDYLILPGHSIASRGPVRSVLLFSPVALQDLSDREIMITGESATSINLLRVLLKEFYGIAQVRDRIPGQPIEELICAHEPGLLIGDRALRQAENLPAGMRIHDLGELWYRQTGTPFVFALWMIRRSALDRFSGQLDGLEQQLRMSRRQILKDPWPSAEKIADQVGLSPRTIVDYWQTIDYDLGEEHLRGLQLFFDLCRKHGLLDNRPELNFFE